MPSLVLTVNVPIKDRKQFVTEFSKVAAETLGKPEVYISISANYDEFLSFHGSFDPAFLLVITSLGNLQPEKNEEYSKKFFAFMKEKFGVAGNRGYITFYDPGNANLGHEGTTFGTIFGK